MRDRVALQRVTETQNSFGEPIPSWSDLVQVWAEVEWASGSEAVSGNREYAEVPVLVRVRRSSATMGLREKDRVLVPQAATKLSQVLPAAGTTMTVNSAGVFPPEGAFVVRVGSELILCSSISGSAVTVARAQFGTTAAAHRPGTSVLHMEPVDIVSAAASNDRAMFELTCVRAEIASEV